MLVLGSLEQGDDGVYSFLRGGVVNQYSFFLGCRVNSLSLPFLVTSFFTLDFPRSVFPRQHGSRKSEGFAVDEKTEDDRVRKPALGDCSLVLDSVRCSGTCPLFRYTCAQDSRMD